MNNIKIKMLLSESNDSNITCGDFDYDPENLKSVTDTYVNTINCAINNITLQFPEDKSKFTFIITQKNSILKLFTITFYDGGYFVYDSSKLVNWFVANLCTNQIEKDSYFYD